MIEKPLSYPVLVILISRSVIGNKPCVGCVQFEPNDHLFLVFSKSVGFSHKLIACCGKLKGIEVDLPTNIVITNRLAGLLLFPAGCIFILLLDPNSDQFSVPSGSNLMNCTFGFSKISNPFVTVNCI